MPSLADELKAMIGHDVVLDTRTAFVGAPVASAGFPLDCDTWVL